MFGSFSLETSPRADRESKKKKSGNRSKRWKKKWQRRRRRQLSLETQTQFAKQREKFFVVKKVVLGRQLEDLIKWNAWKVNISFVGEFFLDGSRGKKNCRRTHAHTLRVRKSWQRLTAREVLIFRCFGVVHTRITRCTVNRYGLRGYWFWKQWSAT